MNRSEVVEAMFCLSWVTKRREVKRFVVMALLTKAENSLKDLLKNTHNA
jgi:hypothetical protein